MPDAPPTPSAPAYDVAVIGGSLVGSMAAIMLRKRGLKVAVLEARGEDQPLKAVVGEALTEGTSVFVRHEIGLGDWLGEHAFRKFGFDFVTQPRNQPAPRDLDGCHELMLSLTPLEKLPGAFSKLIPTYHVDRPKLDAEVIRRAKAAGADYMHGAVVRHVELGVLDHRVDYERDGQARSLRCTWVLDVSGRRRVLGRQLGITRPMRGLETAAIWNRFTRVRDDPEFWNSFRGIDRRKHTIHFTGQGFWFWWIHIDAQTTSVGVSYDKAQHQPDIKAEDRGFWEMVDKFPALRQALAGAEPIEPYSYYANLPHESDHWLSSRGYALIGDAVTFVDALYSIGIEMACRQLVAVTPLIERACAGGSLCKETIARLNLDHQYTQESVYLLNRFKYSHAWHKPHVLMQTALYELAEIAELYHMEDARHWTRDNLDRHYRLQWSNRARRDALVRFMEGATRDGERDLDSDSLLAKGLIPGRLVYTFTYPFWHLPKARPYFFLLTRGWGYMERMAQRHPLWPDFLTLMAGPRRGDMGDMTGDVLGAGKRWIRERLAGA
ncbi:MAG: NAD(P)/FAD-dependent oxidoreductase [Enhygromyxa sp.]